ncbi:MAG: hypothetical protein AABX33_07665 [Nanoarchaeota archaeon]
MKKQKIDGIKLADKMKKGMLEAFFKQVDELRKFKSRLAKQS